MADEKQNPNQINIELTDEIAEGIYSNLAIITHSHSEFVIDYIRVVPGVPKAKVKSRIVLTPFHAKRLLGALAENISKFESVHGEIDENPGGESGGTTFPANFGGPVTQA